MTNQPSIKIEYIGRGYRVENAGQAFDFLMGLSAKGWLQSLANGGGLFLEDKHQTGRGAKFTAFCEQQGVKVVRA